MSAAPTGHPGLAVPAVGAVAAAARPWLIAGGLAAVVLIRASLVTAGVLDGIAIGVGFGVVLSAIAVVGGWRPGAVRIGSVAVGIAGGLALVAITLAVGGIRLPSLHPDVPVVAWAGATVLVASAEEMVLRGALFGLVSRRAGDVAAVAVTSIVFALIHVPLYGTHVIPLDLAVGVWLGGLRLWSGGVAAPALAHIVADLATWWI